MTFTEFSESRQNPKVIWLPELLHICQLISGKKKIPLIFGLYMYLFNMMSDNRYLPRGSNEKALCITTNGNVFIARHVI